MKDCLLCKKRFDPAQSLTEPAQIAGQLLAEADYGDAGQLCLDCLASRGRLAMMYRSDCFD
jgi:hypothetical protein